MDEVYKKLDLSKIRHSKILSSEEALRDMIPIEWSNDVINGNKTVFLTKITPDSENKRLICDFSY